MLFPAVVLNLVGFHAYVKIEYPAGISRSYVQLFLQVITGCEGSLVRTWNVETGKKVFEFLGVVGKDEMSCMALEGSGRRLFTGSRTGMVYVSNF